MTSSTSGLRSSFKGGLPYEVQGDGLLATIHHPEDNDCDGDEDEISGGGSGSGTSSPNRISVCGSTCELVEDDSSSTGVTCLLPQLNTKFSTK